MLARTITALIVVCLAITTLEGQSFFRLPIVGYKAGAGGTVTQATSKVTGVTLSKMTGQVTLNAAVLAAGAEACFTVTNTLVGVDDVVITAHRSGGTAGAYQSYVGAVGAGSFSLCVSNVTAGALSEAAVISFVVVKGAAS